MGYFGLVEGSPYICKDTLMLMDSNVLRAGLSCPYSLSNADGNHAKCQA